MDWIGKKVVVTTEFRGVFFGCLTFRSDNVVELLDCRNCVFWSKETKGFIGLAVTGPTPGSRVGPAAAKTELRGVTSITECTDEAIARWESAPWT